MKNETSLLCLSLNATRQKIVSHITYLSICYSGKILELLIFHTLSRKFFMIVLDGKLRVYVLLYDDVP